ncbi:hypothetical protein VTK73DRAFT_3022 [Phialemonium thermophilum]|uniref:Uncharacterized protein n=1 Tax=Phialemonium thermophilum TaxID=223376 RepID=A0ABR3VM34_9PEZI
MAQRLTAVRVPPRLCTPLCSHCDRAVLPLRVPRSRYDSALPFLITVMRRRHLGRRALLCAPAGQSKAERRSEDRALCARATSSKPCLRDVWQCVYFPSHVPATERNGPWERRRMGSGFVLFFEFSRATRRSHQAVFLFGSRVRRILRRPFAICRCILFVTPSTPFGLSPSSAVIIVDDPSPALCPGVRAAAVKHQKHPCHHVHGLETRSEEKGDVRPSVVKSHCESEGWQETGLLIQKKPWQILRSWQPGHGQRARK